MSLALLPFLAGFALRLHLAYRVLLSLRLTTPNWRRYFAAVYGMLLRTVANVCATT